MSMIFNGMMAGLGQGIATMGAAWGKRESELEELKLKAELRRQEKLEQFQQQQELKALVLASRASGGGKGSDVDLKDPMHRRMFGLEDPDTVDRSQFKKEVDPSTATDELGNPMPKIQQDDEEGYQKARKGIVDRNLRNYTLAQNPSAFKAAQEGMGQEMVNDLIKSAQEESDPKVREALVRQANKTSIALGGKERFKISDGTVVDVAEGATETTEVGKSKVNENKAQAGKHSAEAGKAVAEADKAKAEAESKRRDPADKNDGANNARITALREDIAKLERKKNKTPEEEATLKRKNSQLEAIIDAGVPKKAAEKQAEPKKNEPKKADQPKAPPSIASVRGAPKGSSIGSFVEGRGWEVKVNGKTVGYVRK